MWITTAASYFTREQHVMVIDNVNGSFYVYVLQQLGRRPAQPVDVIFYPWDTKTLTNLQVKGFFKTFYKFENILSVFNHIYIADTNVNNNGDMSEPPGIL